MLVKCTRKFYAYTNYCSTKQINYQYFFSVHKMALIRAQQ